ncbi:hypothetical protein JB92DRAFT_2834880 [Gautieria morchelliformis]|nr:hypothetical protein JB92DRAFT_2834880 [Gautieria morchelliformis]
MHPSGKNRRKGPTLTYRQRQQARAAALSKRVAINNDVDSMLRVIDHEAKRLSKKHHRSIAWFQHQFFQGGRVVRQKRAVSVFNAAKQIEGFLEGRNGSITDEEKTSFQEIQTKLYQMGGAEFASKLPHGMQVFLRTQTQIWHNQKHTAPRASIRAVVQDGRLTLERVADELIALSARTDMETFLFAVKGKPEHSMPGFFAASEKGSCYVLHGMKRHTADLIKEFESYVLGDVEGLILNHNRRLAKCKSNIRRLIREGLVAITGDPKTNMQYERYEKLIVLEKGVALTNWPPDVPFGGVSDIGSFHHLRRLHTALTLEDPNERCKWVTLSSEELETRRAAFKKAEANVIPKQRKRKTHVAAESDTSSSSESDSNTASNEENEGDRRSKRHKTAHETDKENDSPSTAAKSKVGKKKGGKGRGKGKATGTGAKGQKKDTNTAKAAPKESH